MKYSNCKNYPIKSDKEDTILLAKLSIWMAVFSIGLLSLAALISN